MDLNQDIRTQFNRGWKRFLDNIIFNITGYELLDEMSSKQKRGVYIIISVNYYNQEVNVEYIGSSVDMHHRLYQGKHDVFDVLKKKENDNLSYPVFYIDTSKYIEVEKLLIKSLRPVRNIQHNNG